VPVNVAAFERFSVRPATKSTSTSTSRSTTVMSTTTTTATTTKATTSTTTIEAKTTSAFSTLNAATTVAPAVTAAELARSIALLFNAPPSLADAVAVDARAYAADDDDAFVGEVYAVRIEGIAAATARAAVAFKIAKRRRQNNAQLLTAPPLFTVVAWLVYIVVVAAVAATMADTFLVTPLLQLNVNVAI
jgi:hypothetical protein